MAKAWTMAPRVGAQMMVREVEKQRMAAKMAARMVAKLVAKQKTLKETVKEPREREMPAGRWMRLNTWASDPCSSHAHEYVP